MVGESTPDIERVGLKTLQNKWFEINALKRQAFSLACARKMPPDRPRPSNERGEGLQESGGALRLLSALSNEAFAGVGSSAVP